MDWLRRLVDRWRHPAEYEYQRIRRRRLEGIRLAERDRDRPDFDTDNGRRG